MPAEIVSSNPVFDDEPNSHEAQAGKVQEPLRPTRGGEEDWYGPIGLAASLFGGLGSALSKPGGGIGPLSWVFYPLLVIYPVLYLLLGANMDGTSGGVLCCESKLNASLL